MAEPASKPTTPPTPPTDEAPGHQPGPAGGSSDPGDPTEPRLRWPWAWVPHRLGEGATGPLMPIYAATFAGASAGLIGLMEACFQALSVLGAFVWGRTSDEVSKRKAFILIGFLGSAVALAGMAFSNSFWAVFAWRGLKGFVTAAYVAVGGALMADQSRPGNLGARMGLFQAIGGAGYVAGLAISAYVALFLPPGDIFAIAALTSLVAAVVAMVLIHEPEYHLRRREVHQIFRNTAIPFAAPVQRRLFEPAVLFHRPKLSQVERRAWAYLGAIALAFLGTTAGFVLFPLYLKQELGVSTSMVFVLFMLNALLSTLLYRPAGRLADKLGYRKLQLGAFGTRSFMFLFLAVPLPLIGGVAAAVVFLCLAGISWAVVNTTGPAALFRGMAIRNKGELVGLYSMAAGTGALLGALVGGFAAELLGYRGLFLLAGGLVAVSMLVMGGVVYPRGGLPQPKPA